ncbi:MAG: VTC domain-containing protein [Aurantibacter sp.]
MNSENRLNDSRYRFERKFFIRRDRLDQFLVDLLKNGFSDIFYRRQINNLYLDNSAFEDVIDNVEGFSSREKTRIRWYGGLFERSEKVLEQKIKSDDVNRKESIKLGDYQLNSLDDTYNLYFKVIDHLNESKEYLSSIHLKRPTLLNRYKRNYFMSADDEIRVTLDQDLFYYSPIFKTEYQDRNIVVEFKSNSEIIMQNNMFRGLSLSKYSKYVKGILSTSTFSPIY